MVAVCDWGMSCIFSVFHSNHGVSEVAVYFDGTDRWMCGSFLSGACGMGESWDGLVCADCSPHYSARNGSCGSTAICLSACQQIYFVYGDGCCDRNGSVLCGH